MSKLERGRELIGKLRGEIWLGDTAENRQAIPGLNLEE